MSELIVTPILNALDLHADLIGTEVDITKTTSGMFIYVPSGMHVQENIYLSNAYLSDKIFNLIILEQNSSAVIIEDYHDQVNLSYSSVTQINLAANAQLTHYKMQRENIDISHNGHVIVRQMENSCFNSHLMSVGAKNSSNDLTVYLSGNFAKCNLNGLYAPTSDQRMYQRTNVYHEVSNCESTQDYKGILSDNAKASFEGLVVVNQFAKQTVAKQQNKNLLLSRAAEITTKPQLEIYADDVVCTHGATVGQLDEDALFYFATRGIDKQQATQYLVQAFAEQNLRVMPEQSLAKQMQELMLMEI